LLGPVSIFLPGKVKAQITDTHSAVFAAVSGATVGRVGYFMPFLVIGSGMFAIGGSLTYTLGIGSSAAKYIGYQLLLGIGQGLCIQIPVIASQAFAQPEDIPAATSMILCEWSKFTLPET